MIFVVTFLTKINKIVSIISKHCLVTSLDCHLAMVKELVVFQWSQEQYHLESRAPGRVTHGGKVRGKEPDKGQFTKCSMAE